MKTRFDYLGLSTDDKPTNEAVNGSTFKEVDTSKLYIFYKGEWYEKVQQGGGSSEYNVKIINPFTQTTTNAVLNNLIQELPLLDMTNVTSMNSFFMNCLNLTTISLTNTGNINSMQNTFQNCTSLLEVSQFDTHSVINMQNLFNGCSALTTIPILNTEQVANRTGFMNTFAGCNNLSDTSLNNILQMCINATEYNKTSYNKTLANLGLSSAQATTCQGLSNWDAFVTAGWTTGY